jgi:hypothetical protein
MSHDADCYFLNRCQKAIENQSPDVANRGWQQPCHRFESPPVDLTLQHTNHTVLVEGPEIMIRPVGTRRVVVGGVR